MHICGASAAAATGAGSFGRLRRSPHAPWTTAQKRRAWRVIGLTVAIALMSLADLQITLVYLRSGGMGEGNPFARWIISGGTGLLVRWKLTSVVLACGIFLYARKSRSAELGAWICCGIMVWLTCRWIAYSREVTDLTPVVTTMAADQDGSWVAAD